MGDARVPAADNEGIRTLDELIRRRGQGNAQTPILAYPKSKQGLTDYEFFSGKDINRLVDGAAKALMRKGFEPVTHSPVLALYSNSDRDFFITFLALNRLGYVSLMLSPRLAATACLHLLRTLDANTMFYGPQGAATAAECERSRPLKLMSILKREEYDFPQEQLGEPFVGKGDDPTAEHEKHVAFLHSSGSSGIPKAMPYRNARLLNIMSHARDVTHFLTLPIFHGFGIATFFHCFYVRNTCYVFNGNMPQTHETLTTALKAAQAYHVVTVPYALKLFAEKQDGIDALKAASIVTAGGSRIVDEVGDALVEQGVYLGSNYGSTEVGHLLSSTWRPKEDKAWNYLEAKPNVVPFVQWKPYSEGLYECVVLDGFGGKSASNSMEPPNSYHTSDLWTPHPTLPNRWKYVARIDDRITLMNGEKVLPLEIEGRIRKDPLVREAIVFGIDRPVPGLLIAKADAARDLSDEEFLDRVWLTIQYANRYSEAFAQITREVIVSLPPGAEIPLTDKMSVKRALVYVEFANVIDNVYKRLDDSLGGDLRLTVPELEEWIMNAFKTSLGVTLNDAETDFFFAGVDSLKSIQMRGLIARTLDLGGNAKQCGSMVVSDCGNAAQLARFLYRLRTGEGNEHKKTVAEEMQALIDKFSGLKKHVPGGISTPNCSTILLTGVTGSLGIHILSTLSSLPTVSHIYCLIRAPDSSSATSRLHSTLSRYGLLPLHPNSTTKVTPIPTGLSTGTLSLPQDILSHLYASLTHIIHTAWPVNFTLPLSTFTPHLSSLHQLLNLAQSVKTTEPAHLLFASSVGVANAAPPGTVVPESPLPSSSPENEEGGLGLGLGCWTQPTGYALGKLVGEKMLEHAVRDVNARATILRIGQIVPSSATRDPPSTETKKKTGRKMKMTKRFWNPNEMVPLIVRAAVTGFIADGAVPRTLRGGDDACTWIPVDVLARSIAELAGIENETNGRPRELATATQTQTQTQVHHHHHQLVYNLINPTPFSWQNDFLPSLRRAAEKLSPLPASASSKKIGNFPAVIWEEWLERLENSDPDVRRNPSRKLLGFWARGSQGGEKEKGRENGIAATANQGRRPGLDADEENENKNENEERERDGEGERHTGTKSVEFSTTHAQRDSQAIRTLRPVVGVGPGADIDAVAVEGDEYVSDLLAAWLDEWKMKLGPEVEVKT